MRLNSTISAIFLLVFLTRIVGVIGQETDINKQKWEQSVSLLDNIRNEADSSEFFSPTQFVNQYYYFETTRPVDSNMKNKYFIDTPFDRPVWYPITCESCRVFASIYAKAKSASRAEIVECLNDFDNLSLKGKAFVLASTYLYFERTEGAFRSLDENRNAELLSEEEKSFFWKTIDLLVKDDSIAFKRIDSNEKDWEDSFRKNALAFQKTIGPFNPYYLWTEETENLWKEVCNNAPVIVLYSMLSIEVRLDLKALGLTLPEDEYCREKRAHPFDENAYLEARDTMRCFVFLQRALDERRSYYNMGKAHGIPGPRIASFLPEVKMSDVAKEILNMKSSTEE